MELREYRRRKACAEDDVPVVHSVPSTAAPRKAPGPVESAWLAELADLIAAKAHPGLVATAIALAQLIDDPMGRAQRPAAAQRLQELRREMRKGSTGQESALAAVRALTSKDEAS
jgi:hypothetical protein